MQRRLLVAAGIGLLAFVAGTSTGVAGETFPVSGSVEGLARGAHRQLVLTIGNPYDFQITVTRLTVAVEAAGPRCGAANVTVAPFEGSLAIPGDGHIDQNVDVVLAADAPRACDGATWPLSFGGRATSADGSVIDGAGRLAFIGSYLFALVVAAAALLCLGVLFLVGTRPHRARSAR